MAEHGDFERLFEMHYLQIGRLLMCRWNSFWQMPRSEIIQKGTFFSSFFLKVCLQNLFHVFENTGARWGIAPEEKVNHHQWQDSLRWNYNINFYENIAIIFFFKRFTILNLLIVSWKSSQVPQLMFWSNVYTSQAKLN